MKVAAEVILFEFLDATQHGYFKETSIGGIIIPVLKGDQGKPRWGRILDVGSEIKLDVAKGDYIYMSPLTWSFGCTINEQKVWRIFEKDILMSLKKDVGDREVTLLRHFG